MYDRRGLASSGGEVDETYHVSGAPPNSNGPISTVASLHLDTRISNLDSLVKTRFEEVPAI